MEVAESPVFREERMVQLRQGILDSYCAVKGGVEILRPNRQRVKRRTYQSSPVKNTPAKVCSVEESRL